MFYVKIQSVKLSTLIESVGRLRFPSFKKIVQSDEEIDMESARYVYQEAVSQLKSAFKSGKATLFRCVSVAKPDFSSVDVNNAGIYWGDWEGAAECYWGAGEHKHKIVIRADVPAAAINTETTVLQRMEAPDENEITLHEHQPITITGFCVLERKNKSGPQFQDVNVRANTGKAKEVNRPSSSFF